jgi:hypothetical protein
MPGQAEYTWYNGIMTKPRAALALWHLKTFGTEMATLRDELYRRGT